MRNIKLVMEYDGSAFYGFQRQPQHPTIQRELEKALEKFFCKKIKITAASGRTDTGVHAAHQVVNFLVDSTHTLNRIQQGLNHYLPEAIAIVSAEEVPAEFHARYHAKSKTYEYRIWNAAARSPLRAAQSAHVRENLNLSRMRQAAKIFIGKHDFRAFAATDPKKKDKNTVRRIKRFTVRKKGPLILLEVQADGFLYHMVRNLVGAIWDAGAGRVSASELRKRLKMAKKGTLQRRAPAQGLVLAKVTY